MSERAMNQLERRRPTLRLVAALAVVIASGLYGMPDAVSQTDNPFPCEPGGENCPPQELPRINACYRNDGEKLLRIVATEDECGSHETFVQISPGERGPQGEQGEPGEPGASGVTDHGALTGLRDDDHPQYVLQSGDFMSGDLTFTGGTRITGLGPATGGGQPVTFEQGVKRGDAAGGDLGGTYPNPSVTRLTGNPITGTTDAGDVLRYNAATDSWVQAAFPRVRRVVASPPVVSLPRRSSTEILSLTLPIDFGSSEWMVYASARSVTGSVNCLLNLRRPGAPTDVAVADAPHLSGSIRPLYMMGVAEAFFTGTEVYLTCGNAGGSREEISQPRIVAVEVGSITDLAP